MGVDYTAEAFYGFTSNTYPSKFPDSEFWYEDAEDGALAWLKSNGWDKLYALNGGNQMSGPERWQIYIESTRVDIHFRYSTLDYKYLGLPDTEAVEQLMAAYNALDLNGVLIGWVVALNVW